MFGEQFLLSLNVVEGYNQVIDTFHVHSVGGSEGLKHGYFRDVEDEQLHFLLSVANLNGLYLVLLAFEIEMDVPIIKQDQIQILSFVVY